MSLLDPYELYTEKPEQMGRSTINLVVKVLRAKLRRAQAWVPTPPAPAPWQVKAAPDREGQW